MFLKNYTSAATVTNTIARIEAVLIRCGVTGITKEYGPNAVIAAVLFEIPHDGKYFTIRIPADVEQALDALWNDYCEKNPIEGRRRKKRGHFADQAARTAWKLAQDWIEVEMSRLQLKQSTDPIETFLSYIWDNRKRQTFFQVVKESGYRALLPERSEAA